MEKQQLPLPVVESYVTTQFLLWTISACMCFAATQQEDAITLSSLALLPAVAALICELRLYGMEKQPKEKTS